MGAGACLFLDVVRCGEIDVESVQALDQPVDVDNSWPHICLPCCVQCKAS
jgi:hypothetical protein